MTETNAATRYMRAAMVRSYGPPELIQVEEVPVPELASGAALVEVHAAAVNFPDVLIIANEYQVSVPLPFTPGSEYAGVVTEVAPDVQAVQPGDRVSGGMMAGAFAEQLVVPAASLSRVDPEIDLELAAAFPVAHMTAYHALRSVAEPQPGEWVCVLGAAGGVGLASVEIARLLGARVVAVARRSKHDPCLEAGAEVTLDSEAGALKEQQREVTKGGVDVVIDPVGGPLSEQALRATRWGGRFVTVGYASGEIPRIPLNLVLLKGVIVKGFEIRTFGQHAGELAARDRAEAYEHFRKGRLRPRILARFPLEDVVGALQHVVSRQAVGKVIVRCREA